MNKIPTATEFSLGRIDGKEAQEETQKLMVEFAKSHVKEAVRGIVTSQIPALAEDLVYLEQFVNYVLRKNYPIDEKIV